MTPYEKVISYKSRSEHYLIGLMSGTSLDGVDAALVKILTDSKGEISNVSLKGFIYLPYSKEVRDFIGDLCSVETAKLDKLVLAQSGLSEWYAAAVIQLLTETGFTPEDIDAICSHGQTVWHSPEPQQFPGPQSEVSIKSTLQLGDPSVIAERTGIPVVSDFRTRDMAAGGEGAPLVPYLEQILFKSVEYGRILQNIGGIGNATVISKVNNSDIYAFDTGPGNLLMDSLIDLETNGVHKYDDHGKIAATGKVCKKLLDEYLCDPYYSRKPPKSTGREVYSIDFAKEFLRKGKDKGLPFNDILATATALTATTIVRAYEDFVFPKAEIDEVIVSGGGAHNHTLLKMIETKLPSHIKLKKADDYNIPSDAKEALAFAVLGHETLMGRPSNVPKVTGAKHTVILGNVTW